MILDGYGFIGVKNADVLEGWEGGVLGFLASGINFTSFIPMKIQAFPS